ncbi:transcriptional regulator GcvA [Paucibacter sp. DJ2R-2]|uniref:transcriptional regulator GcvA n=1 Tax=Paucibacter sp. DJ2R-2 TaxID=2893558 RepID=UPI0021E43BC2|nr:transcriptional regulator GcvA [Paucibacter sp. DJ2R-2]MCV2419872.1 transcriptional regulator GcvA [Paucibacter sp. DJ4R-1]MCV2437225.1 transcriptional regulator GcvA [Paucibacter sp. DJ2R-2]
MPLSGLSLNTLRAFEAAARHLNFTRAAEDLCVTQAAVSHQVKALEAHLGRALFRRNARGLVLTDEGAQLAPVVQDAFGRIERSLDALRQGGPAELLTVGVVGTFAMGFLLERLADFRACHPRIELRLLTNNNKVDLAGEGLDLAIRFGDGAWRSVEADVLLPAPMTPLCSPAVAAQLRQPEDLARHALLRSYRGEDWQTWLRAAGVARLVARGPVFDASALMVQAALLGEGVALAPPCMFRRELLQGRLVQPFALEVDVGAYWLTRLLTRPPSPAMVAFRAWLLGQCGHG